MSKQPLGTVRVFLFDRWLEIDRDHKVVRVVPLRAPSIATGLVMLLVPGALLMAVRSGARELSSIGLGFVVCYSLLAVALIVMPFRGESVRVELDLEKKVIRRVSTKEGRSAETPLSDAALRFVGLPRRGEAFATIGGEEIRFLYLANDFSVIARMVVHTAAAAIRGDKPQRFLTELATEAKRHEWKAYLVHSLLPITMVGFGLIFYRLYLSN